MHGLCHYYRQLQLTLGDIWRASVNLDKWGPDHCFERKQWVIWETELNQAEKKTSFNIPLSRMQKTEVSFLSKRRELTLAAYVLSVCSLQSIMVKGRKLVMKLICISILILPLHLLCDLKQWIESLQMRFFGWQSVFDASRFEGNMKTSSTMIGAWLGISIKNVNYDLPYCHQHHHHWVFSQELSLLSSKIV